MPNVLTILGVILFPRAGRVVANAKLTGALLILLIANSITFLTALSLSAVAANTRVGVGGACFLVSRSLALELGGSIGVPLLLARTTSVAFCLVGFSESLRLLSPEIDARVASSVNLGVFIMIAWFSAGWAVRTQYVIRTVLTISLISFFSGYPNRRIWSSSFQPGPPKPQYGCSQPGCGGAPMTFAHPRRRWRALRLAKPTPTV